MFSLSFMAFSARSRWRAVSLGRGKPVLLGVFSRISRCCRISFSRAAASLPGVRRISSSSRFCSSIRAFSCSAGFAEGGISGSRKV